MFFVQIIIKHSNQCNKSSRLAQRTAYAINLNNEITIRDNVIIYRKTPATPRQYTLTYFNNSRSSPVPAARSVNGLEYKQTDAITDSYSAYFFECTGYCSFYLELLLD